MHPTPKGGLGWKAFASPEPLYRAWGPHPDGPWVPFHCVPLFAALDRTKAEWIGPRGRQRVPESLWAGGGEARAAGGGARGTPEPFPPVPSWLGPGTWTILDAPGRQSVEAAAWLVVAGGSQPVCTFDNWYFLDDSILPGPGFLARNGVQRVGYLHSEVESPPVSDLENYFSDLLVAGIPVLQLDLPAKEGAEPFVLMGDRLRRRAPPRGYRRSAAGGFGTTVPEPSSGSSG